MRRRLLLAVVSLFLILVLTATQAWAIFNCYDYVFWRLTGLDAMPPVPGSLDSGVKEYGPACVLDRSRFDSFNSFNSFACIEAVLNKKGNYTAVPTDTRRTPVPRLAPGDVIYIPNKHVVYSEGFNYDRDPNLYDTDPNRDIKPRDYPILSHYFEIPMKYYRDRSMEVIYPEDLKRYRYGYMGGEREGVIGGYSERDTFRQMLEKDRSTDTGYIVYKKHRLDVIIEVRDGSGKPLRDALIELDGKTYKTGDKGRRIVELEPDKYRDKDLPFVIRKAGFKDEKRALYAFQMKPSADFIVYPVDLDQKELDALIRELDAQLEKKRNELESICPELESAYGETGKLYGEAYVLYHKAKDLKPKADKALADCGKTAGLRSQIHASAGAAETKSAALNGLIDQANAVVCNTKLDETRLSRLWAQIQPLSWDVYNNAVKADTLNRNLQGILDGANEVYAALNPDPASVLMGAPVFQVGAMMAILNRIKDRKAKALDPAVARMRKLRSECQKAHSNAADTVQQAAAAQGIPSDPRVGTFRSHVQAMSFEAGKPCDEENMTWKTERWIDSVGKEEPETRKRIDEMRKMPLCAGQKAEDDAVARSKAAWPVLQKLSDSHLLVKMDNCKAALSKKPAAPAPAASATKPLPPPGPVLLRIDGPTEAFVGDKMNFKAVIMDKQYASDILRPDGAYAMYWKVDGKRRGDMQYYSDTVNFTAANVGTHTLTVDFVWGSPKTGKVTLLGSKTIQVVINKKESQDYANVNVPHGTWVKTGLSVKKGDVFEIEAKGAYTTKDGGKIGPEGGGRFGWWTLAVRYGKKVHLPGRWNTYVAEEGGDLELGTPRGAGSDKFLPGDIENLTGELSVRVTVKRKTP
jgi:hypothetical protein